MNFKNVYVIGIMIFAIIFSVFMGVNIFFRDIHYYKNSILLNAFFVPFVCAIGAYISVISYKKWKHSMSFKEAYGRAFLPMFVGGVLSMLSIFVYITYIDTDTKDLLNHQYIESYKNSLEEEYQKAKSIVKPNSKEMTELLEKYEQGKVRIQEKIKKNEDMFSAKYFGYIFAGYCAYFLILSLFFGSFFRNRSIQ